MTNKLTLYVVTIAIFAGMFAVFVAVNAKSLNLFCLKKQNIVITLKNDADIDASKDIISKIPHIKIINITYRDKEWSKMVNKMDLPKMENPFKNEFVVKTKKNANTDEIFGKIKAMEFVEKVGFAVDNDCSEKQK